MKLNDNLNKDQKAAIVHVEGALRVVAGPGSGKTRVLTHKIAYLIDQIGYNPEKILAVTFTNKAANEMKQRTSTIIGTKAIKTNILTFHSLALKILREEISILNYSRDFKIIDTVDQKQILRRIYKNKNFSSHVVSYSSVIRFISEKKINKVDIKDLKKEELSDEEKINIEVLKEYQAVLKERKVLDFDDLLIFVDNIFFKYPKIKSKWANKFDYILVDEFQDTSAIQYSIIKYLSENNNNICVVGDIDQTIYTWRGADVDLFLNFNKDFENTTTITLTQNYRSTKNILRSANSLIKYNKKRVEKELVTDNPLGRDIYFYHGYNSSYESRWIANKIKELRKGKCQLKDIAIFYRSNYLSKDIEQALIEQGIEYKIFGGTKFFQRAEIKDVLSFLSVIDNSNDDTSFLRIINVPSRKIGPSSINLLIKKSKVKSLSLYETIVRYVHEIRLSKQKKDALSILVKNIHRAKVLIKKHNISKVLESFLESINYLQSFNETEENERVSNIKELLIGINKYQQNAISNGEEVSIALYFQKIALFFAQDEMTGMIDYVSLMTVHTAKGLEYKNVFLCGFSEGVFPTYQAIEANSEDAIEEERRLAYVAITRAKENLFISDSKGLSINQEHKKKPSRFLKEMDIEKTIVEATQVINISSLSIGKNETQNFVIGDKIKHIKFGFGQVVAVHEEVIDVTFPDPYGVKSLMKNHKSIERG